MREMKKLPVALLLLFVTAFSLRAYDKQQYILRSITVNDGLSNNSVFSIIQDKTGYMWFATKDGLNRYDGSNIRHFYVEDGVPGNNYINVLCEAEDGVIWMGTRNGVCYFDPLTETIRKADFSFPDGTTADGPVDQLVKGPDGKIYIPFVSKGMIIIESGSRQLRLSDIKASSICFDALGKAYLITDDKELLFSSDNLKTLNRLFDDIPKKLEALSIGKTAIVSGRLYSSSMSPYYVDLITGDVVQMPYPQFYDLKVLPSGEIWIGTVNGLVVLDKDFKEKEIMYSDIGDPEALHDNSIHSICLDRSGGVWTGTYFSGVAQFACNFAKIRHYYPLSSSDQMGQRVRKIVPDADGSLWIGTEDRFLMHYLPKQDRFEYLRNEFKNVIESSNVHGIANDGDCLWLGTFSLVEPMIKFNKITHRFIRIPGSGTNIFTILKASDGLIWLGTWNGLKTYDEKKGVYSDVEEVRTRVQYLFEDDLRNIWAGTYGDGLWKYDRSKRSWKHYAFIKDDPVGIPDDKIIGVFEDGRSRIWITTEGGGICSYEPTSDSFHRLIKDFPYSVVYSVVEDSNSTLWISTNSGLVQYSPETGRFAEFDLSDVLLANQFNNDSGVLASDGKLYFGTTYGMVSFDPVKISMSESVPPVVFTSFSCKSRLNTGDDYVAMSQSIQIPDKIILRHKFNSLVVGVSQLDYQVPHLFKLVYMIKGYPDKWLPVTHNEIALSRLRPGSYKLIVRSLKIDGTPSNQEIEMKIRIRRPLFFSIPAIIAYSFAFLALVAFVCRALMNKSKLKARLELEQNEIIRERNLYASKFEFFTSVAHEIRTPLALIEGPVEEIKNSLADTKDVRILEDLDFVTRNTKNLSNLVNELLDFRKIEKGGYKLDFRFTDVSLLLNGIFRLFKPMAKKRRIAFNLSLPEKTVTAVVDEQSIGRIFSNFLSNAFKYSSTFINLKLESDGASFKLTMTNDGNIVPLNMRESIFKPFVRFTKGAYDVSGTGIGLALCRSLAELHNGSVEMDRDLEVNRFILSIPLEQCQEKENQLMTASATGTVEELQPEDSKAKMNMLVVEDNEDMRAFISRIFCLDYNVTTVTDGQEALDAVAKVGEFAMVVSDVMMAGMNGFEFCRRMKNDVQTSHVPIVLLTAKTDIGSQIEGLSSGADAYIEKPFSVALLQTKVKSILENRNRLIQHFAELPLVQSSTLAHSHLDEEFLSRLNNYIDKNIDNVDLSVKDMSSSVFMSSTNLFRKLKSLSGMSPNDYLKTVRMKKAAVLLQEGRCSIVDVSEMTGFRTHSYFSNCFKKQYGITPKEFQERYASNA